MILVTGATGTIGKELVQDLSSHRCEFKVMVRKEETRAAMEAKGISAVLGDFSRPETFAAALNGVKQVFLLTTPQPDLVKIEGSFLEAARTAGVARVVRLSSMGADPWAASPLARGHGQCEARLEASGMAWTILRSNMFMQNLAAMYGASVAGTSTLFAPAGDARIPWVDARDIAAVARIALTDAGHQGLVYEITGPEPYTYESVAELLGAQLGRKVKFVNVPDDAACSTMTSMGMSAWMAHSIVTLFHLFRANGSTAVATGTVARITGRPARTLKDYLHENIAAFRGTRVGSPVHTA
ncbi:MAG: SDR family oxidoreductase [Holophaga sp.]|nr:SDR family oxidoreductase [Holophaga sp.]